MTAPNSSSDPTPAPESCQWFEYPLRVQPHHTDYGGVVWHGTYITWLEAARVECLRMAGLPLDKLVQLGYDLPVVSLDIRYRKPLTLGMAAVVKTRLAPLQGIRLNWIYEIVAPAALTPEAPASEGPTSATTPSTTPPSQTAGSTSQIYLTGQVTLVTVEIASRKVARRLPRELHNIFTQVSAYFNTRSQAALPTANSASQNLFSKK